MFEAVCESWQTRFRIGRKPAVAVCAAVTLLVGLLIEEEAKMGAWMDFITILVIPFGALLGAVSIYFVLGPKDIGEEIAVRAQGPAAGMVLSAGAVPLCAAGVDCLYFGHCL